MVEPWLRGPLPGVHPLIAPAIFALLQAREDLANHTEGLSTEQIWARPLELAPVGFHLRHIAGSVDRLTTYLDGLQLDEVQLAALQREMEPGASRDQLLAEVNAVLSRTETHFRRIDPATLHEPRFVGRKRLPSTVAGLIVHIAEHTQRHVGQTIAAAKLARAAA